MAPSGIAGIGHGGDYVRGNEAAHKTVKATAIGSPWLEGDCKERLLRGGSWGWSPNVQGSGYRMDAIVDGYGHSFRVARMLNVQP